MGKSAPAIPSETQEPTRTYAVMAAIALCQGPVPASQPGAVWKEGELYQFEDGSYATLGGSFGAFLRGTYDQDAIISLYDPADQALNYRGIAHLINYFDLGENTQFPSLSFEVHGLLTEAGVEDVNPADFMAHFLPNDLFGPGFASLALLTDYWNYCQAAGLRISPAMVTQRPAAEIIDEILKATNSAPRWSSGVLDIIPYGDTELNANGGHYIPPSAPLYDLTDDDFLFEEDEPPVRMQRKRQADTYNSIKVEYLNRGKEYNPCIVGASDLLSCQDHGTRQMGTISAHFFCRPAPAELAAQLLLQRENIRNSYIFRLGWKYIKLDTSDIVSITDSGLGLYRQWVRITEIDEDEQGRLTFQAEEYLNGNGHAPLYGTQAPVSTTPVYNLPAPNPFYPAFIEPPDLLGSQRESPELWIAVSGQDGEWGGCEVWFSLDNLSYQKVGTIKGSARQGNLTAALPSGNRVDLVNTLAVLMTTGQQLPAGGNAQYLCWCDGEFLSYQTRELTAVNRYALSTLYRGMYGSAIAAHAINSPFVRIDSAVFKMTYPVGQIGKDVYFKFVSFNVYGGGGQSLATVEPHTYRIQGLALTSPLPNVTNVVTLFVSGATVINWTPIIDFRAVDYEVRFGATWEAGIVLGRTPASHFNYYMDGTYWIAAHYLSPTGVTVYSAQPEDIIITGGAVPQNVIEVGEEAPGWAGTKTGMIKVGNCLLLDGAGNILALDDYLNEPDIIFDGEILTSGSYEAETLFESVSLLDCRVVVAYQFTVYNIYDNWLTIPDLLLASDIFGFLNYQFINIRPQISLKDSAGDWGSWQDYVPGHYMSKGIKFRVLVATVNPQIEISLSSLALTVDPPDVVYSGYNVTVAAAGGWIYFPSPYNSWKGVQITILNAEPGDYVYHHGTLGGYSGFWVQIKNFGVGVERNINWFSYGY